MVRPSRSKLLLCLRKVEFFEFNSLTNDPFDATGQHRPRGKPGQERCACAQLAESPERLVWTASLEWRSQAESSAAWEMTRRSDSFLVRDCGFLILSVLIKANL